MSEPSILSRHTGYLVTSYNFFEYEACRPGRRRHVVSRHVVSHDVSRAHPETRRIPRRRARRFRARTLEPRPRNERIYNLSSWVRARCAIATSSVPRTRRRSETIRRRFECAGRRSTARSDAARGRARRSATASDGWKSFTSFVARAGGVASSRARRGRTRSRGTTRPAIRRAGAGHRLIEG